MFIKILKILYHTLKYLLFSLKGVIYTIYFKRKKRDKLLNSPKSYIAFFTHNLGGGTEAFTKRYISEHKNVIQISNFSYAKKDFYYILQINYDKIYFKNVSDLFKLLNDLNLSKIIINSLVSYYSIEEFISELILLVSKKHIPVTYMTHDFHAVCPSINLIHGDWYCNVRCKELKCKFSLFENCTNISINTWRSMWEKLFTIVNEIRVFSNSSKGIFIKAYPRVDPHKITVIPHDMSYFKYEAIDTIDFPLNIGIFGNCSTIAKGKLVINDFIKYCKNKDIKIFLAGNYPIKDKVYEKNVVYLGRYDTSEMRDIIEKNKLSIVFFPSICPETFSYLVSELMLLNMPIICFNYGAQAEKISNYEKGLLLVYSNPGFIFDSVVDFHRKLSCAIK